MFYRTGKRLTVIHTGIINAFWALKPWHFKTYIMVSVSNVNCFLIDLPVSSHVHVFEQNRPLRVLPQLEHRLVLCFT